MERTEPESQAEPPSEVPPPGAPPSGAPPPDDGPPRSKPASEYQQRGTVAAKAFRGLFWMASTGIGSRIVSLVSTLLLTRYILPDEYGEVQITFIMVWMVDLLTQVGVPSYVAGRAGLTPKKIFHATFYFHLFGVVGLALCLVLAEPLGPMFGAPHMRAYMPGFVFATALQRLATIPDRILVRDLRFRASSVIRAMAEVVYALVSLGLAYVGTRLDFNFQGHAITFGGGFAIVWGGIARGGFRAAATLAATRVRDWLTFSPIDKETSREIFAFGIPITVAQLAGMGSRRWDNVLMGHFYGPTMSGIYNFAYNLADVPPSVVGEALGDVLAPSLSKVTPEERPQELVRWVAISALVCFPLGIGLSAVAHSLAWMFNDRWLPAIPMIVLLCSLSLTRPVVGTVFAYLQVLGKTRTMMILEWSKAIGIVVTIFVACKLTHELAPERESHLGPLVACLAVGLVMVVNTVTYQYVGARAAGIPATKLIWPVFPPLFACVPMVLAVAGVRFAFGPVESRSMLVLRLGIEILVGGAVFASAAFVVARKAANEFLDLIRTMMKKRKS